MIGWLTGCVPETNSDWLADRVIPEDNSDRLGWVTRCVPERTMIGWLTGCVPANTSDWLDEKVCPRVQQ